jgi:hypothetical protein
VSDVEATMSGIIKTALIIVLLSAACGCGPHGRFKAKLLGECKRDAVRQHKSGGAAAYVEACMGTKGYIWSPTASHCDTATDIGLGEDVNLDPTCYVEGTPSTRVD